MCSLDDWRIRLKLEEETCGSFWFKNFYSRVKLSIFLNIKKLGLDLPPDLLNCGRMRTCLELTRWKSSLEIMKAQ